MLARNALDFTNARPRSSSPSNNNSSPGSMPNTSRARFGMTICPRSPTRTEPKMCLPRGGGTSPSSVGR